MTEFSHSCTTTALEIAAAVVLVLASARPGVTATVTGQVVDARTGVPLAGAKVSLSTALGTSCDAQGRWPGGQRDTSTEVAANHMLVINEGGEYAGKPLSGSSPE